MHCEWELRLRSYTTSYCLIEVVTKAGFTDSWSWCYIILYMFSVVDNFELIVGLGIGIPLFFITVGLIIVLCVYKCKKSKKYMMDDLDR